MNKTIFITIFAIVLGGASVYFLSNSAEQTKEEERNTVTRVQASRVSDLGNSNNEEIYAYGQVVSVTGIDVVPEINGIVTRVNRRLSSTVQPGDVVIELQGSTQAQQVAQARAGLAQAQAQLAKISKDADASTQAQAQSQLVSANSALVSTQQNTLGSLDTLYAGLIALVTSQIDQDFFRNVNTNFPDTTLDIDNDNDAIALGQVRARLSDAFDLDRSYQDVDQAVDLFKVRITDVRELTREILLEIDKLEVDASLSQNTINSWMADLAAVQDQLSEFNAQANTLESTLAERRQSVISAQLQVEDIADGADREDILSAQASVAQSEANLLSAQIAFGKTRITSPVFGTISEINTRVGQLVGPSSIAFSVANENALRIDANVTTSEARKLSIGDDVLVDNTYAGKLSVIAPSVDSATGRVAVQVLLEDQDKTLVSGSGVGMTFNPSEDTVQKNNLLSIPIESVFVRSGDSYVYVLQDNKAVPQKIVTNNLFGSFIEVTGGLGKQDILILSARGVKDNESVEVIVK